MYIAFKEARETKYWLRIISESKMDSSDRLKDLNETSKSLVKLLSKITKSTRESFE